MLSVCVYMCLSFFYVCMEGCSSVCVCVCQCLCPFVGVGSVYLFLCVCLCVIMKEFPVRSFKRSHELIG